MLVAITGAAGNLGQAVRRHAPSGCQLRLLDRVKLDDADAVQVELEDGAAVAAALRGVDAVLHLAALPGPNCAPAEVVYRSNTMGTYLVCQACQQQGIGRLVFSSSLCYYGHVFRRGLLPPLYLPLDEAAPPRPADVYSLSKVACEEIISTLARATPARAVSLRFPLLRPGFATGGGPFPLDGEWPAHFWSYLDLDDAARLVWQALDFTASAPPGHEPFVAVADDTRSMSPTAELLARYYPNVADHGLAALLATAPFSACYTTAKAKRLLGFAPSPPTWRTHG